MKNYLVCIIVVLTALCSRDFDNPSDSGSERFSVRSKAEIHQVSTGNLAAGDTVKLFCGVTSKEVAGDRIVEEYRIDFDGDGSVDTVLSRADTIRHVYEEKGSYTCRLVCVDRAGYKSSAQCSLNIGEKNTPASYMIFILGGHDTLTLDVEKDSTARFVSETGDTVRVKVDQQSDSVEVISQAGDTVKIPKVDADTVSISVVTIDSTSLIVVDSLPVPHDTTVVELHDTVVVDPVNIPDYLPVFPNIPGFPDISAGDCAFFAEDSSLMRTTMNCYDVMWEQTKADGFQTLEFIGKMISDIIGYSLITVFGSHYTYTYNNGAYLVTAPDFTVSCAFHYGAGVGSHAENDTVKANIFSTDSYISGIHAILTSPFYEYTKGPLFDLIDGDISIDGSLNVTYGVNFSKLKMSFFRETVHELPQFPLGVVNDSIQLKMRHDSFARMAPVAVRQFDDRFHEDSILIDHGGTVMTSQPVELKVTFAADSGYRTVSYAFTTRQIMNSQLTRYGNHGDTLKVSGSYRSSSALGFDGHEQWVYFSGRYSSTVSDSSWFYCDDVLTDEFGTLFFGDGDGTTGEFTSDKFGYSFRYTPLRALPAQP